MTEYQAKTTIYQNGKYSVDRVTYDFEGSLDEHVRFLMELLPDFFNSQYACSISVYDSSNIERLQGGFGDEYDPYQGWKFWELTGHNPDTFAPVEF